MFVSCFFYLESCSQVHSHINLIKELSLVLLRLRRSFKDPWDNHDTDAGLDRLSEVLGSWTPFKEPLFCLLLLVSWLWPSPGVLGAFASPIAHGSSYRLPIQDSTSQYGSLCVYSILIVLVTEAALLCLFIVVQ